MHLVLRAFRKHSKPVRPHLQPTVTKMVRRQRFTLARNILDGALLGELLELGSSDGTTLGTRLGSLLGVMLGIRLGATLGNRLGARLGIRLGSLLG
jgi:hypothetical protein